MELLLFGTLAVLGSKLKNTPKPEYRIKSDTLKYNDPIPEGQTDRYDNLGYEITNEDELPFNPIMPTEKEDINPIFQNSPFVPFFRSEKSQNTNDEWKQQRLNTFTGMNNFCSQCRYSSQWIHTRGLNSPTHLKVTKPNLQNAHKHTK